jgi:hypothetical protein
VCATVTQVAHPLSILSECSRLRSWQSPPHPTCTSTPVARHRDTVAAESGPGYVTFYLDGVVIANYTPQTVPGIKFFTEPNYFIINTALGDWGPMPSENTVFPGYFSVEYVRVAVKR